MRLALIFVGTVFACGSVLAQAPAGTVPRPAAETNPNASGGVAQARAAAKTDARTMGAASMDANGDGLISKKEWDAYHLRAWRGMKADKRGMVPWSDVQSGMSAMHGGTPK